MVLGFGIKITTMVINNQIKIRPLNVRLMGIDITNHMSMK